MASPVAIKGSGGGGWKGKAVVVSPEARRKAEESCKLGVSLKQRSVAVASKTKREPLTIFYESLSKQIPSSEMAEFWMMEHGLLSPVSAKKAYERKQRRQQQIRTGTPIKSRKQELPESSKRLPVYGDVKAKKRVQYSDDEDDFIVKHRKIKA